MASYTTEYNLLNSCEYIKNIDQCVHDTNCGFEVVFGKGVNPFEEQSQIDIYDVPGGLLWGFTSGASPYISMSNALISPVETDLFSLFELDMRLSYNVEISGDLPILQTGKMLWRTETDTIWKDESSSEFEVYLDGAWHHYSFQLLENKNWVGNCNYLKLYPLINGFPEVEVMIQRIALTSTSHYKCNYPPCGFNRHYKHPCQGIGSYACAKGGIRIPSINIDYNKTRLGVAFDGYEPTFIDLDMEHCHDTFSVAQAITLKLNSLSFGGYKLALCYYDSIEQYFYIQSGTRGSSGRVQIFHGGEKDITEALGFFNSHQEPTYIVNGGNIPADGFVEKYKRLPTTVLYRLSASESPVVVYDPKTPIVQIGRADVESLPVDVKMKEGMIGGTMMVDINGICDYYGKLNYIMFRGEVSSKSKILLCRPTGAKSFQVVYTKSITSLNTLGGTSSATYKILVDWDVIPGDVIGLYMCAPALSSDKDLPLEPQDNYINIWVEIRQFNPEVGNLFSYEETNLRLYGYASLPVYGCSSELNPGYGIEVGLRYEAGIKDVKVIGTRDWQVHTIEATKIPGVKTQLTTNLVKGSLVPFENKNFYPTENLDQITDVYLDIWFPHIISNIYQMLTTYESSFNIRCFSWERYIESEVRNTAAWYGTYTFPTDANVCGSEIGWERLVDPTSVVINEQQDATYSLYLASNYVTISPYDYYPGVDYELCTERSLESYDYSWNTLQQTFPTFGSRAIRLYIWTFDDPRINSIKIFCYLPILSSTTRSVRGFGTSGPIVFDTEAYDIVDLEGSTTVRNNISRATTEDYTYPLSFVDESDELKSVITASVQTTLRKLELDISLFPTRVNQILLIPQHLAMQLRTEGGGEPITEITNLSWGAPSDNSSFTYGPAQQYEIYNDTGHKANLLLDVASPMEVNQACVFSSNLSSMDVLNDPDIGSPAVLIAATDTLITNNRSINYRAPVYSPAPIEPTNWFSSTYSGIVWQLTTSGTPFVEDTVWNEPVNPYDQNWHIENWARCDSLTISGGNILITNRTRPYTVSIPSWSETVYSKATDIDETELLECRVLPPVLLPGIDSGGGIVIWDQNDPKNHFCIERYSGNGLDTVSGYLLDNNVYLNIPLGDYIRCGTFVDFYTPGGKFFFTPVNSPDYGMVLKMFRDHRQVSAAYRLSWDTWTTVSSIDISTWSRDIVCGMYGLSISVADQCVDIPVTCKFDYVRSKTQGVISDGGLSIDLDFNTVDVSSNYWSSINSHKASTFKTIEGSTYIVPWVDSSDFHYLDYEVLTPGISSNWGTVNDSARFTTNIVVSSGVTGTAGIIVRNKATAEQYFLVGTNAENQLGVRSDTGEGVVSLSPAYDTTSGIWLRMDKSLCVLSASYSYDGLAFTTITGKTVVDWGEQNELELLISTDKEAYFTTCDLYNSNYGCSNMMAQFDPPAPVLPPYGRGFEWTNLSYSSTSGIETIFNSDPSSVSSLVKFDKDPLQDVDISNIRFLPNVKQNESYPIMFVEVPGSNEALYDRLGQFRAADPKMQSDGSQYIPPDNAVSTNGLPKALYPVIIADLGHVYQLGRFLLCPESKSVLGTFSSSDTPDLSRAQWEKQSFPGYGFGRKCLFSSNMSECTAGTNSVKPIMLSSNADSPQYYPTLVCDGNTTEAGAVFKACPAFTPGRARWLCLESQDFVNTSVSAGAQWFFGPIQAASNEPPIPITNNFMWWTSSFGFMQWIEGTADSPNYTLIYSYPGFNTPGSCYFNGLGNDYWRFTPDRDWTMEDSFLVDLRYEGPVAPDYFDIQIGKNEDCCYKFLLPSGLTTSWQTYSWKYSEAELVLHAETDPTEPSYTEFELESYLADKAQNLPLPYLNYGYAEVTVSGSRGANIYIRDFKHSRNRFNGKELFLGLHDSVLIPNIDLMDTGTIKFDYRPSLSAVNLKDGDPRDYIYTVFSVTTANAGFCVTLNMNWGWNIYCYSPKEQQILIEYPSMREVEKLIPSLDNPGPFHITFSWAPATLPGLTDSVMLWVNGIRACGGIFTSIGDYFVTDDIKVVLGKAAIIENDTDTQPRAAYAYFSNLKVFKQPTGVPDIDLSSETLLPENLIEISKDGEDWASFTNGKLPILYPSVENGERRHFYLRNKRPQANIKKLHTRSNAYLLVKWEVHQ